MPLAGKGFLIAVTTVVAGLCAAQAMSNAWAKRGPDVAAALSPYAAESVQKQAIRSLRAHSGDQEIARDPGTFAIARKALSRSLLMTEAAAVAGLSSGDPARRSAIFDAAQHLSHRGRLLQGALFQYHAEEGDLSGALVDLDHLYRAYPETSAIIMPVLIDFFAQQDSDKAFQEVLQTGPSWADAFFREAAQRDALLLRLARLRGSLGNAVELQPKTDQLLAGSLVRAGKPEAGYALYNSYLAVDRSENAAGAQSIDWTTAYPPFGWRLADRFGFYARVEPGGERIKVVVRPGQGGIFAERLIGMSDAQGAITVHADFAGDERVFARLSCANQPDLAVEQVLDRPVVRLALPDQDQCSIVTLSLGGRAWSSGTGIFGTVSRVSLSAR
ncbi:hypothetical protein [Croceicoccus bisphenolivorans]|uniref:hypothetical protein n=1 Tax=Croceicoccus bisphenolivorans TaxID=1783232 RepID=UPI0008297AEB|nr:hypothetical protein [Croceicoccus bisphenolivorans]